MTDRAMLTGDQGDPNVNLLICLMSYRVIDEFIKLIR